MLGIDVNKTTFVKDRECCIFEDDESKIQASAAQSILRDFNTEAIFQDLDSLNKTI